MYPRSGMIRIAVLLLIAYLCGTVSSDDDCIKAALEILRGGSSGQVEEPQTTSTPSTPSTVKNDGSSTTISTNSEISFGINDGYGSVPHDDVISFEKLYLELKSLYVQKVGKLQIENDLLKKLYSSSNSVHTIQTFCTCNVTDRPIANDCNNLQTNIFLEKVQEIHQHLLNITENDNVPESDCKCNPDGRSNAESQFSESYIDWKQLPGAAVEISAKGTELWVINSAQNIYRWDGSKWELKPGAAVRVGTSPDGWTWVVNSNDNIYRWNVDKKNWDIMPGALVQISAISKDIALGVNRQQKIFLWSNNAWKPLPGGATWAGIGYGDERWVVSSNQQIFRWNHPTNNWNKMPGAAVNIDVQNPCRVIVTNAANQVFIWRNNNWQMLNGAGRTKSSINESHYYTINSAQHIFIGN